jgi:hypothetical protein
MGGGLQRRQVADEVRERGHFGLAGSLDEDLPERGKEKSRVSQGADGGQEGLHARPEFRIFLEKKIANATVFQQ